MADKHSVTNALVKEIAWADAKEVLKYFMQDKTVKYAYVKLLLDAGLTSKQVQQFVKISPQAISEIRNKDTKFLMDNLVEVIRDREINKLYLVSDKMLQALDSEEKLKSMKGGELAYAYKTLLDARRLLENKSTANISVQLATLNQKFSEDAVKIATLLSGIAKKNPQITQVIETEAEDVRVAS